jgi:hypothetical protein
MPPTPAYACSADDRGFADRGTVRYMDVEPNTNASCPPTTPSVSACRRREAREERREEARATQGSAQKGMMQRARGQQLQMSMDEHGYFYVVM